MKQMDKKTVLALNSSKVVLFSGSILTLFLNLKSGVSHVRGFLFGLWCQGTGQYMRKHWWQNSTDPSKPQSCGLSQLHLTVRKSILPIIWQYKDFLGVWNVSWTHSSALACKSICLSCEFVKLIMDIHYWSQMPVLFLSVYWVGCWISVLERCSKPSKERLSVFLENVRQEMPKAHLELLHSGSLCVTAEASGVLLCLPA